MSNHNQLFSFDEPIPSIMLHSLKFSDGKWKYVYSLETPAIFKPGRVRKNPLYFKGYITNMTLISNVKKNMVNTPVRSREDVINLLNEQRKADLRYRKRFREEHADEIDSFVENTFTVKNKSQNLYGAYIVSIKEQNDEETTFVGRRK